MIATETCLHDLFRAQAAKTPDAIALVSGNERITYSDLDQATDSLGAYLRQRGVLPDDRVGVLMETCSEYIVACIGALKAGAAFMPLDLTSPDYLLKSMVAEAQPRVVLTKEQHVARSNLDSAVHILAMDADQSWRAAKADLGGPVITSNNLAFVPYTSGTTGDPKGVMQTHGAVISSYFGRYKFSSYQTGDRVACNIFFIWEFLRPLLKGGTVYVIPDDVIFLPRALTEYISENRVSEVLFTPSLLQGILNSADHDTLRNQLESLRVIWLNGEVVASSLMEQASAVFSAATRLFNTYSICETHDVCTVDLRDVAWDGRDACPVGFPMDGVTVRVLPEGESSFATIGIGDLYVGGLGLARGYLGREDLDKQKFVQVDGERYYATGDLAEVDSQGIVTVGGRNDSMVKIRGYSVYLSGIEETLRKHCDVLDTVVSVEAEDETNKRLIAYVIRKPGATWRVDGGSGTSRDLRNLLERYLPHYMVPSRYMELDELPINQQTGKLNRKALPKPRKMKERALGRVVNPEHATMEDCRSVLRELWSEALDLESGSLDDDWNFFELGGHSLSGLGLTLGMERAFGIKLQGTEIYDYQTINKLAAYLGDRGSYMDSKIPLVDEARLDPDIVPSSSVSCNRLGQAASVFMTGATGFLGAFLLDELLRSTSQDTKFYCLVRGKDSRQEQTTNRVLDTLRFYGLAGQTLHDRIIPVTGDLTQHQFGLGDQDFNRLAEDIDLIFHCAASVNYVYTYTAIKPHTVGGTLELVKFACRAKTKPIQYISSNGVFPGGDDTPYLENSEIESWADRMDGGYNQAKWVAEMLVWSAVSRGLPVCIFRPGNIGHHSVTGVVNPNDFQTLIIKACLRAGCAPKVPDWLFEMTPVDFLVQAITKIADDPMHLGKVYNVVQGDPVSADQVFTYMQSNGYITERVALAEWKLRLGALADRENDLELKMLIQSLDSVEGYLTDTSVYDISRFSEVLTDLGIPPPTVDVDYVTKFLRGS